MTLTSVEPAVTRDRFGRPMIIPPGGGRPVAYTRCTTYTKTLEDTYNLGLWQQRMVAIGLADRPDLLLSAAAHRGDKDQLNRITEQAVEAARAHAAATVGTALHAVTQQVDTGQPIGTLPGEYERDIDAYTTATAAMRMLHVEQLTVLDDLKIGGTPDRVVELDGHHYIADVKTGSIEYGAGAIAMQLAVYAHSQLYTPRTGERTPLDVHHDKAIVIHLPAGTGTCALRWVDIAAGWEAVQHATWVRAWRNRKNLLTPINPTAVSVAVHNYLAAGGDHTDAGDMEGVGEYDAAVQRLESAGLITRPLTALIGAAQTVDELNTIWANNVASWTNADTAAAARRKQTIIREGARA